MVKMSQFWPQSKAITFGFDEKLPELKLIDFDWRLKSGENEPILAKK